MFLHLPGSQPVAVQIVSKDFLGTAKEFLGTCKDFLGTAKEFLGTCKDFLGISKDFFGGFERFQYVARGNKEKLGFLMSRIEGGSRSSGFIS